MGRVGSSANSGEYTVCDDMGGNLRFHRRPGAAPTLVGACVVQAVWHPTPLRWDLNPHLGS